MWSHLSFDVLSTIFSFLSPDSLARASSVCHHWHTCVLLHSLPSTSPHHHLPWFLALPTRNRSMCCYVHNPVEDNWHLLSLDFLPDPVRPVTSIGSLLLFRPTNCTLLRLGLCNPFTRKFKYLPALNVARTNPAVGLVVDPAQNGPFLDFRVYVAGGMSENPRGGAMHELVMEMYDSRHDTWQTVGPMPVEFAVRLTVWTPDESVYTNGMLYWITSARAYSVMGLDVRSNTWRELSVPMADRLEFAALTRRNGKLTLVGGGTCVGGACVWELDEEEGWWLIEKVPIELGLRLLGERAKWGSIKCVGRDGAICLYREVGSGMVIWRPAEVENGGEYKSKSKWEWIWVDGCCFVRGKQVQNVPVKGVLLHPTLALSCMPN